MVRPSCRRQPGCVHVCGVFPAPTFHSKTNITMTTQHEDSMILHNEKVDHDRTEQWSHTMLSCQMYNRDYAARWASIIQLVDVYRGSPFIASLICCRPDVCLCVNATAVSRWVPPPPLWQVGTATTLSFSSRSPHFPGWTQSTSSSAR